MGVFVHMHVYVFVFTNLYVYIFNFLALLIKTIEKTSFQFPAFEVKILGYL